VSSTSYVEVMHHGGPLGGQQQIYAGEPSLRRALHGGAYVRSWSKAEDGSKVYAYTWEADEAVTVPQDGDHASALLDKGDVVLPEGASVTIASSGDVADEGGSETGGNQASTTPPRARTGARASKG
jgi:hypothetical protein